MNYKNFKERISYLEELKYNYGFLTSLNEEQKNKLQEKINDYKKIDLLSYKGSITIPGEMKELDKLFKNVNLDYNNITSTNNSQKIRIFIELEIERLLTLKNNLYNLMDTNYIFDYESIKNRINRNKLIRVEDLNKFNTKTNTNIIPLLIYYTEKLNKAIFNKKGLEEEILLKEKNFIKDIEDTINSICSELKIDYDNKEFIEKYFDITDNIEIKIENYNKILKETTKISKFIINIERNISKEMKKTGLDIHITFDQLKYLSNNNIDEIIEEIKMYESAIDKLTEENTHVIKK